jgi:hypothetical protein
MTTDTKLQLHNITSKANDIFESTIKTYKIGPPENPWHQ